MLPTIILNNNLTCHSAHEYIYLQLYCNNIVLVWVPTHCMLLLLNYLLSTGITDLAELSAKKIQRLCQNL